MLKIAQITDPHLVPRGETLMDVPTRQRFLAVLEHARAYDPDEFWFTGDFCSDEPREWVYEYLAPKLCALGKPFVVLPGNHDNRAMMRRHFELPGSGDEPIFQHTSHGAQHFVFLDTCHGHVEESQLGNLEQYLDDYPGTHIAMHHPPVEMGLPFMDNNYPLRNTGRLVEILHRQPGRVRVFCGHYHNGRVVSVGNITVHLCPPTSFFIAPGAEEFEQEFLPPAYQQLEWDDEGVFRAVPVCLGDQSLKARR